MELDYTNMIEAGVHFGHQKKRWNPKFKAYLYKHMHGISIIDLERTQACLQKACEFLTEQVENGANVLLVGTKKQAQEIVREVGQATSMPFCSNRWLGGCLTNFETVKASLAKYQRFLQMEESGELNKLPKKESAAIRREMVRMHRSFEGILHMTKRPDVLLVVDAKHEAIAIHEAKRLGIPVIGIADTNSDPTVLDFPIPANDDSVKSLRVIFDCLQEAIAQGVELKSLKKSDKGISRETAEAANKMVAKKHNAGRSSGKTTKRSGVKSEKAVTKKAEASKKEEAAVVEKKSEKEEAKAE